jgi:hypothetical protein
MKVFKLKAKAQQLNWINGSASQKRQQEEDVETKR